MKRKHLLIESGVQLDDDSRCYCVMIGQSKSDTRDYLYLVAWSVQHGCYFKLWDKEVSDFYQKVRESVPNMKPMVSMSAREMVKHIKADSRPELPQNLLTNQHHMLKYLNVNYRINRFA